MNCLRLGDDSGLCLLSDLHEALSECAVSHYWHLSCFTLKGKQFFEHQCVQVKTDTRITDILPRSRHGIAIHGNEGEN